MPASSYSSVRIAIPSLRRIGTSVYLQPLTPLVLGLVLSLAGGLKLFSALNSPPITNAASFSRELTVALSIGELVLAMWLISGFRPQLTRWLSLGFFFVFLVVSSYKAISGEESCACLGEIKVNPWYSAMFNATAIGVLALWRPDVHKGFFVASLTSLTCLVFTFLIIVLGIKRIPLNATIAEDGEIHGYGNRIAIEPTQWVEGRFPLLGHIDIGPTLSHGQWFVLIYRRNCKACLEYMPTFERLAEHSSLFPRSPQCAIVEVDSISPQESFLPTIGNEILRGRLSTAWNWIVRTPLLIRLSDGKVLEIVDGEDSND
jgi:hypothetical protein